MTEPSAPTFCRRSLWMWINMLGLDAVLAALVWMKLFAHSCRAVLIPEEFAVLGGIVWLLYMADRMLDGCMSAAPRYERHYFAARHWRWLVPLLMAVAAICAWLLLYRVRSVVFYAGKNLAVGVAVYFALTWVVRKNLTGLTGALAACGFLAVALMQGNLLRVDDGAGGTELWPHLWRGALAGLLLTIIFVTVRRPGAPPPWTLPRKLMGGWLFAVGTALAPFAHIEAWQELLFGAPVLTFAAVCAANSLTIRLAEAETEEGERFETALLQRLHPWLLITVTAGAVLEWQAADNFARPHLAACGAAAFLLTGVYFARRRLSPPLVSTFADAAVILPAAVAVMLLAKR